MRLLLFFMFFPTFTHAVDPLNGTSWKTIDDKINKPTAIIQFKEEKNGSLSATIQKILVSGEEDKCKSCEGEYRNKSLIGMVFLTKLKRVKNNEYDGGKIIDPDTGKYYNFSVKIDNTGRKLTGRAYIGVSLVGRNQTWYRFD
ncbi:DUF2147 domain-containing protein [Acinetobacter sp. C26M]|uniref:DUF2147 domain-containing protein n=1 Tax=unclassified Acinetobacter TaxID=196816 RepID=UPI0020369F87|nr:MULTISPECIES: DUF2147 domain-containing protein [unclassified Acinetobacter]USA47446.1 DUF2147 domain-containing protein [Acinetobacter sp. C26M]USA50927.1 DUF2147 domain-containing protein [Acinetobacter sp. C26G]